MQLKTVLFIVAVVLSITYTTESRSPVKEDVVMCPMIYQPVCDSNGKTYGNSCEFGVAKRKNPSLKEGPCSATAKPLTPVKEGPIMCPMIYQPVCDSNGKTYGNSCQFNAAKRNNPSLKEGPCSITTKPPTPVKGGPIMCTMIYKPVCDSNGKTYGNSCEFNAAKRNNPSLKEGPCSITTKPPTPVKGGPIMCTMIYKPVCGSDGKTYGNACLFGGAKRTNSSLTSTEGACPTKAVSGICTREYFPYCGSDGKTYGNKCEFGKAEKMNSSLTGKQGACPEQDEDDTACIDLYDPYCGSDGIQYSNACELAKAEEKCPVLSAKKGECVPEEAQ